MKNKLIVFSLFIIYCITLSGCKSTSGNYPSVICPKPFSVHGSFDLYLLHSAEDVTLVLGECMHLALKVLKSARMNKNEKIHWEVIDDTGTNTFYSYESALAYYQSGILLVTDPESKYYTDQIHLQCVINQLHYENGIETKYQ